MKEVGADVVEGEKEGTEEFPEHAVETPCGAECYTVKFRVFGFGFRVDNQSTRNNPKLEACLPAGPELETIELLLT